jgi:hypothetical protein
MLAVVARGRGWSPRHAGRRGGRARELEARYLAGHSSLLPDAEAAWERFGETVDRMWSMAEDLVPTTKARAAAHQECG